MRLSVCKTVGFAQTANKLGITLQYLVQELAIVNVVATFALMMSICGSWWRIHQKLGSFDSLEIHIFIDSALRLGHVNILQERSLRDIKCAILVEEVLSSA